MSDTGGGLGKASNIRFSEGTLVWIKDHDTVWKKAEVLKILIGEKSSSEEDAIQLRLDDDNSVIEIPAVSPIHLRNDELLSTEGLVATDDLTQLMHLHEPAVLHSLNVRFDIDKIYTFTGPILIAVNPFKEIRDLYDFDNLQQCISTLTRCKIPHVFAVANAAYRGICDRKTNQTILISGESGAGKTESTKHVMKFLALAAAKEENQRSQVEKQVLESNPLLEAFGNARTLRNNNSSRFGKYIEMQFALEHDRERGITMGRVCGARIHTYLLEKVRVCDQQDGERNFHIFYQLCAAASRSCDENGVYHFPQHIKIADAKPESLELGAVLSHRHYTYLTRSSCYQLDGVDEVQQFETTIYAMQTIGMTVKEQMSIFRVVAAVLYLGNVAFQPPPHNSEGADIMPESMEAFLKVCELLSVDSEVLRETMCFRKIRTQEEEYLKPLKLPEADETRDALSRALYGSLFAMLVERTNESIGYDPKVTLMCGVLDIFGFECFETNSFEQLCINFTNERLQQFFNTFVFKCEEELYKSECISWDPMDFPDNQDCVELLQQKNNGIFSMLDEECMVPQGSDRGFCNKVIKQHVGNRRFEIIKTRASWFAINHFAGAVRYNSDGFIDKNKDHLSLEVQSCVKSSTDPFVAELFKKYLNRDAPSTTDKVVAEPKKRVMKRPTTVSSEFREQLGKLITGLYPTEPHFIRCIKPNSHSGPDEFDRKSVTEQLRYGGVLQAVKVSRAGYPVRLAYKDCYDDYKVLASYELLKSFDDIKLDFRDRAQSLLEHLDISLPIPRPQHSPCSWAVGKTLCFLKQDTFEVLQHARLERRSNCAVKIQAKWKALKCERTYCYMRLCTLKCQALIRGKMARQEVEKMRRDNAVEILQAAFRGHLARIRFRSALRKVVRIQAWSRGFRGRCIAKVWKVNSAATTIQSWWRMKKSRIVYLLMVKGAIVAQRRWRVKCAKRQLRKLKQEAKGIGILLKKVQDLTRENCGLKQKRSELEANCLQREEHNRVLQQKLLKLESTASQMESEKASFLDTIEEMKLQNTERKKKDSASSPCSSVIHDNIDEETLRLLPLAVERLGATTPLQKTPPVTSPVAGTPITGEGGGSRKPPIFPASVRQKILTEKDEGLASKSTSSSSVHLLEIAGLKEQIRQEVLREMEPTGREKELESENEKLNQKLQQQQQAIAQLQTRYQHVLVSVGSRPDNHPHVPVVSSLISGGITPIYKNNSNRTTNTQRVIDITPSIGGGDLNDLSMNTDSKTPQPLSLSYRKSHDNRLDIVLIGPPGARKSEILHRFFEKTEDVENTRKSTREREYASVCLVNYTIVLDNYTCRCMDCPSSDFNDQMWEKIRPWIKKTRWVVIVYDVCSMDSYSMALRACEEVKRQHVNFMLFGSLWSHKYERQKIQVDFNLAKTKASEFLGLSVESDDLADALIPIVGGLKVEHPISSTGGCERVPPLSYQESIKLRVAPMTKPVAEQVRQNIPGRIPHKESRASNRSTLTETLEAMRSWFIGRREDDATAVNVMAAKQILRVLHPSIILSQDDTRNVRHTSDIVDLIPMQDINVPSIVGVARPTPSSLGPTPPLSCGSITVIALGRERRKMPYYLVAVGSKDGTIVVYRVYRTRSEVEIMRNRHYGRGEFSTIPIEDLCDETKGATGEAELHCSLTGHTRTITSLTFSPLEDCICSTSLDHSTRFFDPDTGEMMKVFTDTTANLTAAFLPLNLNVLLIANTNAVVKLVNSITGIVIQKLKTDAEIRALEFDDTSSFCFAGTKKGRIYVFAVDSLCFRMKFSQELSTRQRASISCITFVSSKLHGAGYILANSCDDYISILDCIYGGPLCLTGLTVRHRLKNAQTMYPITNCFSSAGGGFVISGAEDKFIWTYSLAVNGDYRRQRLPEWHTVAVLCVRTNFTDTLLVSGDASGRLVFWRRGEARPPSKENLLADSLRMGSSGSLRDNETPRNKIPVAF